MRMSWEVQEEPLLCPPMYYRFARMATLMSAKLGLVMDPKTQRGLTEFVTVFAVCSSEARPAAQD